MTSEAEGEKRRDMIRRHRERKQEYMYDLVELRNTNYVLQNRMEQK